MEESRIYEWDYHQYEHSIYHSQGVVTFIKKINKELLKQENCRVCATLRTEKKFKLLILNYISLFKIFIKKYKYDKI